MRDLRKVYPKNYKPNLSYGVIMDRVRFKPRLNYNEALYYLEIHGFRARVLKNTRVYEMVKKLTSCAYPEKLYGDLIWEDFYLPVKLYGKLRLIPFTIRKYKQIFFVFFSTLGVLEIRRGKERVEKFYEELFRESIKFIPILKKESQIIKKLVPYHLRKGKIKAKHVMEDVMPKEEAERIEERYERIIKRGEKVEGISLTDYLRVAGICYKSVFKKKTKGMKPIDMYKRWADGRDCGMLEIKDRESEEEFMEWLKTKAHCGGHPFEIIFSWTRHGILLYPPSPERPHFVIGFGNYAYAESYTAMVKALIRHKIAFRAPDLGNALEFLTGEKYLSVNEHGDDFITTIYYSHHPSERKLFKHIKWDDLKLVKFFPAGNKL